METIKQVLIRRDFMSEMQADNLIDEAKEVMNIYLEDADYESAFRICEEFFGLEPDYVFELCR